MKWQPVSEEEINKEIHSSLERMSPEQRRLWDEIKIVPEKWHEETYGKEGGGFWAVAVTGNDVIWYNDIEEGFNCSPFILYGQIDGYRCNQDQVEWILQNILNERG